MDAQPKPPISAKGASSSSISFLLSYYKPYRWRALACLIFMLPSSGLSLLFPGLTGQLIDKIQLSNGTDALYSTAATLLGLLVVQAVIGYIISVNLARITERVIATLRSDLFSKIIRLPMSTLHVHRVGELASRLSSDLTQIQETFSFSILQLLRQAVFLVGSIIIIMSTSIQLTVPILLGMPVIVGIAVLVGRRIRKLSTQSQDALAVTGTIVEETLQSVTAVKSFVQESYEIQRYSNALAENVRLAIKGARLRALFVTFIIFTIFGGIAAVIIYGASLVSSGEVTMGTLLSFLMYAMFVGGAMGSFAELYGQIQKTLGASVRLQELMKSEAEEFTPVSEHQTALRSVELRNVEFSYSERENTVVLQNINLSIQPGERVAFVGQSGAGKSTTASLIQRLYEPTSGEILYNGTPASDYSITEVRHNIGVVPQDIVLFGGSIRDNIRYGNQYATNEQIIEAARNANVLEFTDRMPEGLDTVVGERGIKLSGGQRQRVAIARALLKNPPILILDEATSSLDAESEHLIQEALQRLMQNRTTIIIAHRLSTVRNADKIVVFANGTIDQQGTHEKLILQEGIYKRWCDLQFLT